MSVTSKKRLLTELKNKKHRDAYAAEHVKTMIPIQARILREQRELSQDHLAERMNTTQSVISRLEDPNYGKLSLSSLLKLASAYDVALLVKFVPFSRLLREFEDASPQSLSAKGFTEELSALEVWADSTPAMNLTDSELMKRSFVVIYGSARRDQPDFPPPTSVIEEGKPPNPKLSIYEPLRKVS